MFSFGSLAVANSTFSGNSTLPGQGGGFERAQNESLGAIFALGPAALDSVTVTGSSAVGIYNSGGRVTLTNSLVGLQSSGADCGGSPITSADFNLDSDGSCDLTAPNDQPAVAADAVGLGVLASNGGFGPTHSLFPWSVAFDHGETVLDVDQRGVPRPQFARDDIGAVEQASFAAPAAIPLLTDAGIGGLALALALAALVALRLAAR